MLVLRWFALALTPWAIACKGSSSDSNQMAKQAASSLAGFQGEIEYESRGLGRVSRSLTRLKGSRIRLERGTSVEIYDMATSRGWALDTSAKTYDAIDLAAASAPTPKGPPATKSSRTDSIAGERCEVWLEASPSGDVRETCRAAHLYSGPILASSPLADWAEGGVPLRVVTRDRTRSETFRLQALRIDEKLVPDFLFEPPSGFKRDPALWP